MALNRIEGYNLYIGGVLSLRNKASLQEANITHVVSVLRMRPDENLTEGFQHFRIEVDDVEDEDPLQYFSAANAFIQAGLDAGGGVLVHCAMGKSRSAAICIAYLLHQRPQELDPDSALGLIRKTRSIAEPNADFMKQLWLYHEIGCPDDVVNHPTYLRWISHRQIELSAACGRAPEIDVVRFEDELSSPTQNGNTTASDQGELTEIRCRKCRRMLATTPFINPHDKDDGRSASSRTPKEAAECAHIFLHPLTWMRPCLFPGASPDTTTNSSSPSLSTDDNATASDAPLSGRLTCPNPKCEANVGKFAWQGLQCSCGKWVVPAIGVARARVDVTERKANTTTIAPASANSGSKSGSSNNNNSNNNGGNDINSRLGAMGIRLPPHMRVAQHGQTPKNNL